MKKPIIVICLVSALSCTKKSSTTSTPSPTAVSASTFNITFNGRTYNITQGIAAITSSPTGTSPDWGVLVGAGDTHIRCNISGVKSGSPATALGIYKSGNATGLPTTTLDLTDYDNGGKRYTSSVDGHDTTSQITVSISNATECKGTFSVILSYNGNYYPATGDFDYKH